MGPYVTIDKLAEHFSVSVSTIRNWIRQGNIPPTAYIKVGTTYRFSVRDVEQALVADEQAASGSVVVTPTQVSAVAEAQELEQAWDEEPELEETLEDFDGLDLDEDY